MLLLSGLSITATAPSQVRTAPWWLAVDLVLGVTAFVLVHWRRRYPMPVALVITAFSAVSSFSGGPASLALVSVATRRRWKEIVPLTVLGLVAAAVLFAVDPAQTGGVGDFLFQMAASVPVLGVVVAWGMYVGSRRELLWTLRDRARRAEDEQATRVAAARTAERTRIAREMHDVLAHRISLVSMHADAMVYRTDLGTEQLRESAAVIQESSHRALVELREVLGVLRDDPGDAAPERPQPGALDVPALVDELMSDGMRLEVDLAGTDLATVPVTTGRTLYRVVQEALTNARKHAPNALVHLSVTGRAGHGLDVEVRNPLAPGSRTSAPQSGLGLVGLAERTSLAGGRIEHHADAGHFVLRAWLPWPT